MRTTPTLAICLAAGVATGIALARPAPTPAAPNSTETVAAPGDQGAHAPAQQPAAPAAGATAASLTIADFAFPTDLVAAPGAAVEIVNADTAPHTVVATDGAFATDVLDANGTAVITAPQIAGTYLYACSIHPSMTGRLIVQA